MSEIRTKVAHPATACYVPKGSRTLTSGVVMRKTTVAMRRASRHDFEPIPATGPDGLVKGMENLHRGEDGYWIPVTTSRGTQGDRKATPGQLIDWMRDPERITFPGFDAAFGGTPVLAGWGKHFVPAGHPRRNQPNNSRGEAGDQLYEAREVRFDGTAAARDRVARFVHENVRLTEHHVFRRCRPLVEFGKVWHLATIYGFNLWTGNRLSGISALPVPPDRAEAAARRWCDPALLDPATWMSVADIFEDAAPHDADIEILANGLPGATLDLVRLGRDRAASHDLFDAARAKAEGLRVEAYEGLVGGNVDADREPLFTRIRAAIDAVTDAYPDHDATRYLRMCAGYIDDEVLPRIRNRDRAIAPDDLEAVGSLAP